MRKDHVLCDCCGKEFAMGLVELSRHRGPVRCPDCEGELQELHWRKHLAAKDAEQQQAIEVALERVRKACRRWKQGGVG